MANGFLGIGDRLATHMAAVAAQDGAPLTKTSDFYCGRLEAFTEQEREAIVDHCGSHGSFIVRFVPAPWGGVNLRMFKRGVE